MYLCISCCLLLVFTFYVQVQSTLYTNMNTTSQMNGSYDIYLTFIYIVYNSTYI